MSPRTATITAISSVLLALGSLAFGFFTWYQDKGNASIEKQAQDKKEILQTLQSIEKALEKRIEANEKAFNKHLLDNQQELFEIRQEISLISANILRAQRQYEYVQSQSKLDNDALKEEIIREIRKK